MTGTKQLPGLLNPLRHLLWLMLGRGCTIPPNSTKKKLFRKQLPGTGRLHVAASPSGLSPTAPRPKIWAQTLTNCGMKAFLFAWTTPPILCIISSPSSMMPGYSPAATTGPAALPITIMRTSWSPTTTSWSRPTVVNSIVYGLAWRIKPGIHSIVINGPRPAIRLSNSVGLT